jgi:hypothetical protein
MAKLRLVSLLNRHSSVRLHLATVRRLPTMRRHLLNSKPSSLRHLRLLRLLLLLLDKTR